MEVLRIEEAKLLPVEKYGCKRIDDTKPFHYLEYIKTEIGEMLNYENSSKKPKKEQMVWLSLNNNSTCSITVPTILSETDDKELKNQSEVSVIYTLSSSCAGKKDKLITNRKQTLSVLPAGGSIYFTVPLRFLTEKPLSVRVPFNLLNQKADFYYQPFYFYGSDLPKNLRKDVYCR